MGSKISFRLPEWTPQQFGNFLQEQLEKNDEWTPLATWYVIVPNPDPLFPDAHAEYHVQQVIDGADPGYAEMTFDCNQQGRILYVECERFSQEASGKFGEIVQAIEDRIPQEKPTAIEAGPDVTQVPLGTPPIEYYIPDHSWDRIALKLWRQGLKSKDIAYQIRGKQMAAHTVDNRICILRREYGEEVVPYRRARRNKKS